MLESYAEQMVRLMPYACAYNQVICNQEGQMIDSVFLEMNRSFEQQFAIQASDWLGKSASDFWEKLNFNPHILYEKLQEAPQQVHLQSQAGYVQLHAFLLENAVFALVCHPLPRDETSALLLQKQALEEAKSNLDFIFNSTQDGMFLAEYKDGAFYYISFNAAHERITGLHSREISGKTPHEVWGHATGERLTNLYMQAILKNHTLIFEENFNLGGKSYVFLTSLSVAQKAGRQYLIASRKDITQYKQLEEHHQVLQERLQSMFHDHIANMLIIDPHTGQILDANPAACAFYGYEKSDLLRLNIQNINTLPEEEVQKQRQIAVEEKRAHFIFPHRLCSGEIRIVEVYSCPIADKNSAKLFSIIFDVTDRENYRKVLFQEKELLHTTLKSIGDGVLTTDTVGNITSLNHAAENMTGWRNQEAIGKPFSEIFILQNEETGQPAKNPVETVLLTEELTGLENNTILCNRCGEKITIADSAAPIKNENGKMFGVVMVFRDVRFEKAQQKEILFLSYHDALTGIYNRRFAEAEINHVSQKTDMAIAVIMGDVNGLKITNDVFGHETGDALLQHVAQILLETCGRQHMVARWGGDEFLVLLRHTTQAQADALVQRLKANFQKHTVGPLQVSVSLGCAARKRPAQDMRDVIREAEELMYRQKLLESRTFRTTIINTLLSTLHEKSMETEAHSRRIAASCKAIAQKMQLSDKMKNELSLFSVLHDIGKVGVSAALLCKKEPLSVQERSELQKHSEIGYRITQNTPELSVVSEYILAHHERWDGTGYPKGLRGEEIPLCCRILSVADAFDAMTHERVYHTALSKEAAMQELLRHAGTQFAPDIVDVFVEILQKTDLAEQF